ncbi:MAG: sigma-70 family RNA polymerase sigma factor [bacterium]|nr:sigma-70 family RNA polymerase sigma factor [bacterium]
MKSKNKMIGSIQISKEEAGTLVKKNTGLIKKIIRKKTGIYSLDFKTTFNRFIGEIKGNDYQKIREMSPPDSFETHLQSLIKKFLVKEAYFSLEEECIQTRILNTLKNPDKNNFNCMEMKDFVTAEIEKNNLEKLYKFREEANVKTFLISIVSFQIVNFWRDREKKTAKIKKHGPELSEFYNIDKNDPLSTLIRSEDDALKKKIAAAAARIRAAADANERVAFDMFYRHGAHFSEIARTLNTSVYKVKKMIRKLSSGIITEVKRKIK